ncbi:MAG TPA: carboxylesterase family protein [Kofleriaceae bacterium]|nr:carboxylesterase family protein [Kofleriaceae bacterium]
MRSCILIIILAACGNSTTGVGDDDDGVPPDSGPASRCVATPSAPDDPDVVVTEAGEIRGTTGDTTRSFLGIPYAAPPSGDRRFRPTAQAECWQGVRDATAFGNVCPQILPSGSKLGDEDCLFLNVWAPKTQSETKRPVMLFIHGGAYELGSGNQDLVVDGTGNLYDGSTLAAEQNAIVVTFNYRLGALGFTAHPAFAVEDDHGSSGNYGTFDQLAALHWIHDNIANFGGDPDRVMIFGESAGGLSVCLLLATPLAKGLFSSAIMESGGCRVAEKQSRLQQGVDLAARVGCDSDGDPAACLRSKSAFELTTQVAAEAGGMIGADPTKMWEMMHGPNLDGYLFTEQPIVSLREGHHTKVPFVVGSNADEFEIFLPAITTCGGAYTFLYGVFGDRTNDVVAQYPCDWTAPRDSVVAAMTDHMFTCEARRAARAAVAGGSSSVRRYFFTHHFTNHALSALDSFHTAELPFVFRTFDVLGYTPTAADTALSVDMGGYWGRIAASGDPNGGSAPAWPAYASSQDNVLDLDMPLAMTQQVRASHCDFWDTFVAQ